MVEVIDDLELRAEPAVIAPNPVDYVHINIELAGSGDDPRMNKDNDDEDIQSPTEDSEDLAQSFEVLIHNQFIVPLVSSLEDNNTSTQSDLTSTESAASATPLSLPSMSPAVPMISILNITPPTLPPTIKTTSVLTISPNSKDPTNPSTTLSATTSTTTPPTTTSSSTSTSTSTTSTTFTFETIPNAYSEDDETDFNWISSDYEESEKLLNVLKIHKIPNLSSVTEASETLFPLTDVPFQTPSIYQYQELTSGGRKRQLFVYNHDQCISYKDGSKSSSHIIYTVPYCIYFRAISEKSFWP